MIVNTKLGVKLHLCSANRTVSMAFNKAGNLAIFSSSMAYENAIKALCNDISALFPDEKFYWELDLCAYSTITHHLWGVCEHGKLKNCYESKTFLTINIAAKQPSWFRYFPLNTRTEKVITMYSENGICSDFFVVQGFAPATVEEIALIIFNRFTDAYYVQYSPTHTFCKANWVSSEEPERIEIAKLPPNVQELIFGDSLKYRLLPIPLEVKKAISINPYYTGDQKANNDSLLGAKNKAIAHIELPHYDNSIALGMLAFWENESGKFFYVSDVWLPHIAAAIAYQQIDLSGYIFAESNVPYLAAYEKWLKDNDYAKHPKHPNECGIGNKKVYQFHWDAYKAQW